MNTNLNRLCLEFLCGTPINQCSFYNVNYNLENQELLLNNTVNSSLVLNFPIKISYQKAFLKSLLDRLESQDNIEIFEDLYSVYGRLVAIPESLNKADYFKHYRIKDRVISLVENVNFISEGTTGLRTWQASIALAEWCLNNQDKLKNKNILELGSGIGFTGLVVSKECSPKKFFFSDGHPSVLNKLRKNINLNYKNTPISEIKGSFENLVLKLKNVCQNDDDDAEEVLVLNLPWQEINKNICQKLEKLDLILAADVVYDSDLFEPLIKGLKCLSENCLVQEIIFSCTERNSETLEDFLKRLVAEEFNVIEENCPISKNFVWQKEPPVRIFRLTLHLQSILPLENH